MYKLFTFQYFILLPLVYPHASPVLKIGMLSTVPGSSTVSRLFKQSVLGRGFGMSMLEVEASPATKQ
jgi:hypothetical protein